MPRSVRPLAYGVADPRPHPYRQPPFDRGVLTCGIHAGSIGGSHSRRSFDPSPFGWSLDPSPFGWSLMIVSKKTGYRLSLRCQVRRTEASDSERRVAMIDWFKI